MTSPVVGVDVAAGRWVGAVVGDDGLESVRVHPRIADLIASVPDVRVIGVDIPIGIPDRGPRSCDLAARRLLGRRAGTVFLIPSRPVLEAQSYAAARAIARKRGESGVAAQAYGLRDKALEVDQLVDRRLVEIHPELSYLAMTGEVLPPKRTWAGVEARRAALEAEALLPPRDLGEAGAVAVDDVLDAVAVAWSALRVQSGSARRVPDDGFPAISY